ncbi:hypothetical protein I4I73_03480 [Pseudonocardia sp. KRD-184]|uniref:Uncharacterized protein n=1 Tax=Pseudonocardia oceani TaxID=2792013 RepID=A0ABS6UK10_9PSEU|nr:hypothetical protein [Pseudonocardia oceani]MBW0088277.1 hypothetical protein [Pseudonocardia oceani]MBW0095059.1 hypothetical protein [Pseudonocardia oceani]MBW0121088.1 hypothetical protein [Pseudonocardia oceani]MBW0131226.1 hypothetical protein [Pseudonocardia oceani]MBW0132607.1 hypothetical protein [Pseudonocardia oceani]
MTAPVSDFEQLARFRDERNQLRNRIDAFARLVDAAERGGAMVMRIEDVRRGLKIGARR